MPESLKILRPSLELIDTAVLKEVKPQNPDSARTRRVRGRRGVRERLRFRRANPLCAMCQAEGFARAALQVDHIVPLSEGGSDDDSNKQGLCLYHHRLKTSQERKK